MFIIAADYMENTNELLDLDAIGMYSWSNSTTYYSAYALTWESVPKTQTVSSDTLSLFMSTNSTINDQIVNGTYSNDKCVTTLLNTDNWTNFVDSDYAQAAIGGPTLEMWIASWNVKYTTLYCGYSSTYPYGYSVGLSRSALTSDQYVTSSYVSNSGYDDTLYFPYHYLDFGDDGWCGGYWLASPNGRSRSAMYNVNKSGGVYNQGYYDDDQNEGTVRPVVALKDSIEGTYDSSTGLWTLFEKAVDELSESSITLSYSETEWTNENVTLTASTSTSYTLQYTTDDPTSDSATWTTGSSYEMTENGNVYFRLTDGTDVSSFYATGTITNIDKIVPTAEISITDHTYNSITVEATGSDDDSGIYSYEFQISEDGENWETTDIIISSDTSYSYTYEELTQYTEYYVRVVVTDVAGNETTSESASVTTSVDLDTAIITLTPSTTEWTNETVTVTATTETAGVYIEMSTDAKNWTETDSLTVSETCTIYARLVDGEGNSSEYALYKVTNIDTLSPTASYEVSSTAESYSNYSTAGTITITSTSYDEEATETSGESGLTDTYYYSIDGGETYYSSTETEYTFTETSTEDDYEIAMYVEDEAGNISEVTTETYTPITGDWVDYPIDINGDGDTTNDWRLFYIDDDGIMFIIVADYMENTNSLLNLSGTGMYSWSNSSTYYSKYALTWESVPSTQSVSSSILSLFMSTSSTINSMITNGTYNNSKCVTTLLNTSNWTNFVNSTYAQYAIGGPTLEMWIASWNVKYTTLYCGYNSTYPYGYSIGLSSSSLTSNQNVKSAYVSNSGYDDTIYFPYHYLDFGNDGWCGGYWIASPGGDYTDSMWTTHYYGFVLANGRYEDDQNEGTVRPVVALKSSVTGTYDSSTGIWTLSK